ncbi:MAG: nucleoside deaminase [Candidatus Omnitrophica bacterium]|nr:nucleoside deaminase [Candidatus Omnitrophota bacterium]
MRPQLNYMRLAIKEARKNLKTLNGGPFGACIIRNNLVLAVAHNTVLEEDATCHAEINAIRIASRKVRHFDLSGCVIYSTTEPCPMCFSAIHWARLDAVIYGTNIADVKKLGFCELSISAKNLKTKGKSSVKIFAHFDRVECMKLLYDWEKVEGRRVY